MLYNAINFNDKFNLFNELWNPKVISEMNDYQFKLVKIQGDFQWHCHRHTDETFIVLTGKIKIRFRDGEVTLNEGEMYVVPKGKEHKPCAENLAKILIIEPRGVVNTGDSNKSNLTADNDIWI
ncbi:MAG: cupin [Flavobacteriales bacterium]|nr:cupin [Flavobacteriaceae bacterium]MAV81213.1 cupin [Flavobacteriales bacterium]MBK55835.1 cupin [Flavobacteriaceae bacterium]|tara:strand:+ start:1850 stop:2218 length:369 start_codon:yes stop_codon:yes gene_type:complete